MLPELQHLELFLSCQVSKLTPNILWSVGNSLHNHYLQVGRGHAAVMFARLSLQTTRKRHQNELAIRAELSNGRLREGEVPSRSIDDGRRPRRGRRRASLVMLVAKKFGELSMG